MPTQSASQGESRISISLPQLRSCSGDGGWAPMDGVDSGHWIPTQSASQGSSNLQLRGRWLSSRGLYILTPCSVRLKNLHCSFSQRCFPSLLDTNKKASRPREETWRSVSWDWLALHSMFGTGKSFQLVLRGQIPHRKPSPKLQEDEAQTKHISRPRCLAWVLAQPYPLVRG